MAQLQMLKQRSQPAVVQPLPAAAISLRQQSACGRQQTLKTMKGQHLASTCKNHSLVHLGLCHRLLLLQFQCGDVFCCLRFVLQILVIEGLHPFYDERVRDLVDFKIYLDISDEIKFAWKIQRDMAERGHSLDSIKKSIEARKPDFDAYIDPQKKHADMIIQVRS
jgi:hypothetical protein